MTQEATPTVLQADEAQEIRHTYARFAECASVLRTELRARRFDVSDDAVLAALLPVYFRPSVTAYPPNVVKAIEKQANAMARMAGGDEDDE